MSALLWLVLVCTGGLLALFKRPTKWGLYVISTMVIVRSLITFGVRPTLFLLGFLQVTFQWLRSWFCECIIILCILCFVTHSNLDTLQQAYSLFLALLGRYKRTSTTSLTVILCASYGMSEVDTAYVVYHFLIPCRVCLPCKVYYIVNPVPPPKYLICTYPGFYPLKSWWKEIC